MDVSVVVPTYNRPDKLREAIESIDHQTRKPDNVIIINDNSTISYDKAYSEIKDMDLNTEIIENEESRGGSGARNRGADRIEKGIIMFLDDDDRWRPKKVENQMQVFKDSESTVGLVYSWRAAVNEKGETLYEIKPRHHGDLSDEILTKNLIGTTSSVAVPKSSFEAVGGFSEDLPALQDWDLWIRLLQKFSADYCRSTDVEWTVHEDTGEQITGQPEKYINAHRQIRSRYADRFAELSVLEQRKADSYRNSSISDKFSNNNSRAKYYYAMCSFLKYPNIAAVSHCLPQSLVHKMRKMLPIS